MRSLNLIELTKTGTFRCEEKRLCVSTNHHLLFCSASSAISFPSFNSAAHVPTLPRPTSSFSSLTSLLMDFFPSPSETRAFQLPALLHLHPCLLLALPQASQNLKAFWFQHFDFVFLLSPTSHSPLHRSSTSISLLRTRAALSFFSTFPSPSIARCILAHWNFLPVIPFVCLLFQGYTWWRCYPAFLLYLLIYILFISYNNTSAPTVVNKWPDSHLSLALFCEVSQYLKTEFMFFSTSIKPPANSPSLQVLTWSLFLAPPLRSLCSNKDHLMIVLILL